MTPEHLVIIIIIIIYPDALMVLNRTIYENTLMDHGTWGYTIYGYRDRGTETGIPNMFMSLLHTTVPVDGSIHKTYLIPTCHQYHGCL